MDKSREWYYGSYHLSMPSQAPALLLKVRTVHFLKVTLLALRPKLTVFGLIQEVDWFSKRWQNWNAAALLGISDSVHMFMKS